jgi:membrane dipeptidase
MHDPTGSLAPLLIDAHQDLAWNVLNFGRDHTRSAADTRAAERESGSPTPQQNGDTLLGWPDYQRGRVALIFATLFAAPERMQLGAWDTQCYASLTEARDIYHQQLDVYDRLYEEHPDKFQPVRSQAEMAAVLANWEAQSADAPAECPVGLVTLMESAAPINEPAELETWWARGVRLIGPAWAGTPFCGGTGEPGPLTALGYELLDVMADLGFGLDLSHMDGQAARQALDHFEGPIMATHANAAALLKGSQSNRHLSDEVIQGILARDGVIGIVPFNIFLDPNWRSNDLRSRVKLDVLIAQIDYICQQAGDAHHVGLGSDFDGGFGLQSVPEGLDTIADLHKIVPALMELGYAQEDVQAILSGNWSRMLETCLPE